eukprot:jgi/Orpsp1_1/1188155/evm.model.d7180000062864.1
MKVTTIITYAIGFVSAVSSLSFEDTILTPSGKTLPESLKSWVNGCANTNYWCGYEADMQCRRHYSNCRVSTDEEYLEGLYYNLEGLSGKEYCSRLNEACGMAGYYNAPTTPTGSIIPGFLLKYIDCKADEGECRTQQYKDCRAAYKDCSGNPTEEFLMSKGHNLQGLTPKKYCKIHKEVCIMAKDYIPYELPSGIECPVSLRKYLECRVGDKDCRFGQSHSCMVNLADCNTMTKKYLTSRNHILGNFTPQQYCAIHFEVCQIAKNYDTPITYDDVYNLNQYLTCSKDDYRCKDNMNSICYAVYTKCINNYPNKDCEKLNKTCAKIYQ